MSGEQSFKSFHYILWKATALKTSRHTVPWTWSLTEQKFGSGLGDLGGGAGKGGGGGGSIRNAGGAFGKREAAHEEEYFHKLKRKQLADLKKQLEDEKNKEDKNVDKDGNKPPKE